MAGSAPDTAVTRWVEGPNSTVLDARIDIWDKSLALHSRGGSTGGRPPRNNDYSAALEQIVRRGTQRGNIFTRILIDSDQAVAMYPDEQDRILLTKEEIEGMAPSELVRRIRSSLRSFGQMPGAKGGNDTKRVRFDTRYPTISNTFRARISGPADPLETVTRLHAELLHKVGPDHVHAAAHEIAAGHPMPAFSPSTHFDVVFDQQIRLAPTQLFGRALELALNIDARPGHFSAGIGTPCFEIIEKAGFQIIARANDDPTEVDDIAKGLHLSDEDRVFIEGSVKRAKHLVRERNRKLVTEFKRDFLKEHGQFFCELCSQTWVEHYGRTIAAACFEAHHAAVQVADMQDEHASTKEDLQLLCANCHRAEHRRLRLET